MNNEIPFTQYLRPNGRPRPVTIEMDAETLVKAQAIMQRGLRFECEELSNGVVSLTIFDPAVDQDVAMQLCFNSPDVPAAVKKLIDNFEGKLK